MQATSFRGTIFVVSIAHTFWVDEAGNTGPNLLDPAQPVLVHAGVITSRKHEAAITAIVGSLRARHSPGAPELKSGILARPHARRAVADLVVDELPRLGIPVLVAIVDKAFAIISFIFDTCLDPDWNPRASRERWRSPSGRRSVAIALHETLPRAAIVEFAEAFREMADQAAANAVRRIAALLELADRTELAEEIRGCLSMLPEQLRSMREFVRTMGAARTPVTSFMVLCNLAEDWLRRGDQTCRIVHDDSTDASTYASFTTEWSRREATRITLENKAVLYGGYQRLRSFESAHSHDHDGLQLADVVAGVFRDVALNIARGRSVAPELKRIGMLPTAPTEYHRIHTMASDEFIRRMHRGSSA